MFVTWPQPQINALQIYILTYFISIGLTTGKQESLVIKDLESNGILLNS
jgi:hypothetical protein